MALSWPLVGRREEVELIQRAFGLPAAAGVVLAGAPGVGKTRLAREALGIAQATGSASAWAVGSASARPIPFGALAHLLPADIPARPGRSNLLRILAEGLVAPTAPRRLVLGVDDAHLLDPSSAALLHHLAVSRQAFVLATIRAAEPQPDAVTSLWKDGLVERIEVQDLSRAELTDLLERVLGAQVDGATQQQLWELTQGNPLFVRELLQAGQSSGALTQTHGLWRWTGPIGGPRLTEVMEARIGGLSQDERAALELVALGEPLEASVVEKLVDTPIEEALERKGLLQETVELRRATIRLSHPLYAEVLRAAAAPARNRAAHRLLAGALEAAGNRRREDILRLATWHLAAGITDRPAVLLAAAQRALLLFDLALAERLARAAFEAGGGHRAGVTLANAVIGLGRWEDAENLLTRLEADARADAEHGEIAMTRAINLFWNLDRGDEALRVLEATRDATGEEEWRDVMAAVRAYLLTVTGASEEAKEIGLAILGRAGASDLARLYAYGAAGHALLYTGRPQQALDLLATHVAWLLPVIDGSPFGPASMGGPAFYRYLAAAFSGHFSDAAKIAEQAYGEAIAHGIDWWSGTWAAAVGWSYVMQGRPKSTVRWLREAIPRLREMNTFGHLSIALAVLAHGQALAGDAGGSAATLAKADSTAAVSKPGMRAYASLARPWTIVAGGELSRAIGVALEESEFLASMNLRVFQALALHDVARLGRPARVEADLRRLAGECEGPLVPLLAQHTTALAGRDAPALDRASRDFAGLGAMLHAAESAAEAMTLYRNQGLTARAAAADNGARTFAAACTGARTPALAALNAPEMLSRRETEVIALAAQQLTNREIADRLGLSVRTIDNHLHRVYDKLDLQGREDLVVILGAPSED